MVLALSRLCPMAGTELMSLESDITAGTAHDEQSPVLD